MPDNQVISPVDVSAEEDLSATKRALLELWRQGGQQGTTASATITRHPPRDYYPLSFAQQRLWFLDRFEGQSKHYHIRSGLHLRGDLRQDVLKSAVDAIVARHESLRTHFAEVDGGPVQVVTQELDIALPMEDLSLLEGAAREAALDMLLRQEQEQPFNLSRGPLLRMVLVKLGAREHLFVWTLHHIVADGWSMGVFNRELTAFYQAFHEGRSNPSGPLPVQYPDYTLWQRQWLQGGELERQLGYWRKQLADAPTLELPTDHPRPAWQTYAGASHTFALSADLGSRLKEFNLRENVTPFMSLLAVCQVLLARYSGQNDILVGSPIANRRNVELEHLIGFFVNTLVLRAKLTGDPGFREFVSRVRATALDAYEHQDLPFEKLVEALNPERDPGRHPLFQAAFALQNAPVHPVTLAGLEVAPYHLHTGSTHFDLDLHLWAEDETWKGSFAYNTDLFDAATIERMAGHYQALLTAMLAEPDRPVLQVPMLSAAERHRILVEWNRTARDYPRDMCVHQLFEEQAERTPDAVAVVCEDQSLTYQELNTRANQLAGHLRSLGVGPDVLVGICVERSLEMVVALLGILKSGGAYVPLDPALPRQRLEFMVEDTGLTVLFAQSRVADCLGNHSAHVIWLDAWAWQPESDNPPCQGTASALAYVVYTSGSTGQPKGVEISHRSLVNCLCHFQHSLDVRPHDRWLALTTLSFDIAGLELWLPLLAGARVILAMHETIRDGRRLKQAMIDHAVTILQATPATWQALLHAGWQGNPNLQILCGGETIPQELADHLAILGSRAWNVYGPTETTIWSTTRQLVPNCLVNIGKPLANTRVYIRDDHGHPVPVGVTGDLFIGGDGVARGYRNRQELTAERFVTDPFSNMPGTRLYQTGDRARWLPDGNIDFLGRLDHQIKIRGHRIELGEIEALLRTQPEIREVAVTAREDIPGDKRLVAYLVARTGDQPDTFTLRARLAEKLPDYMLPNAFIWLDQLPLTPNGKLDRNALPSPETPDAGTSDAASLPINLLELELIRIWRRLFLRENIGRHDNFFALGGHSLLAARLAAEIDKLLGCRLPIAALFQSPTIESLTRRLAEKDWAPPWSSLVPLQPLGSKPPLFLVHGWGGDVYTFLELAKLLAPDQPVYGIQALGLDGKSARHITVEHMANHYVQEIRSFQPEGPYYLGGYSLGGSIAFEVAQQLHRVGQRVAFLAFMDSIPIGVIPWTIYGRVMAFYIPNRCLFHLRRWWGMPNCDRLDYLRGRWTALRYWMIHNRSKPSVVAASSQEDSQPPQVPGFDDYYHAVVTTYRFQRYPGVADVFVSDDAKPHWISSWKHLVHGGVVFHRVPGTHLKILAKDHVPALTRSLQDALQQIHNKQRAEHSSDEPTHANLVP